MDGFLASKQPQLLVLVLYTLLMLLVLLVQISLKSFNFPSDGHPIDCQ